MLLQAIIAGGGAGQRLGGEKPKQFQYIAGKCVAEHTVSKFLSFAKDMKIWVVVAEAYVDFARNLWKDNPCVCVLAGGRERFHSVQNAVRMIQEEGIVWVHDMVRPCVSSDLLKRCVVAAKQYGSAIPVMLPSDSVRWRSDATNAPDHSLDRNKVWLVQTPQTFQASLLKKAYLADYQPSFTDCTTVVAQAGYPLHFIEGERCNIKITYPQDKIIATALLETHFA